MKYPLAVELIEKEITEVSYDLRLINDNMELGNGILVPELIEQQKAWETHLTALQNELKGLKND